MLRVGAGSGVTHSVKEEDAESDESGSIAVIFTLGEPSSSGVGVPSKVLAEESKDIQFGKDEALYTRDALDDDEKVRGENDQEYGELTREMMGSCSSSGKKTETVDARLV